MTRTVIHLKTSQRLAFPIIFLGLSISLGRLWLIDFSDDRVRDPFLLVFLLVVFLMTVVFGGYLSLFNWKYHLEFGDSHLRVRSIYHPFIHRFECSYDDIISIKRGAIRNYLVVVPREGKPLQLPVNSFEGGAERLLNELSERVNAEFIKADIAISLRQYNRFDRIIVLAIVLMLVGAAGFMYQVTGHDFIRVRVAWEPFGKSIRYTRVDTFSLDSDGSPWLFVHSVFRDSYQVQHFTDGDVQTWELSPSIGDLLEFGSPGGVARDDKGYPWVIYDDHFLHWTGETWQDTPFPVGRIRYGRFGLAISGPQVWAIALPTDDADAVIFNQDMASGESRTISAPDSAIQAGMDIRRIRLLADGSVMVLAKSDDQSALYALVDGRWQEPHYPIEMPPSAEVLDFAVAPDGQIWTLLAISQDQSFFLGNLDLATMTWAWSQIDPTYGPYDEGYRSIEVDSWGRVWLNGSHGKGEIWHGVLLAVFEAIPGSDAKRVVRYTTHNSNYQSNSHSLLFGPDGRVWSADKTLVWIDSNAQNLPRPLPDWTVELASRENQPIGFLIYFVTIAIFIVVSLQVYERMKQR